MKVEMKNNQIKVNRIPICDICKQYEAVIDGKTKKGCWAFMCFNCFGIHGVGLGLGKGQELILEVTNEDN